MTQADCGALIRALRDQAGITQAELAEALLRDVAEVAAIEMGDRAADRADVRRLTRVFGLDEALVPALTPADETFERVAA